MSLARVVAVAPGSAAAVSGVEVGDVVVAVNGRPVRDIIEYRVSTDEAEVVLDLDRGGLERVVEVAKPAGAPLGIEIDSALFDEVRTCDNHCEFCFIYQLPPGMRRSLSVKDDDYRLSFLYGNFTTLTRVTEADVERILTEGLSPLYVSIHATDPDVRASMLRNRRGATSLRWLRVLLDHGVEVHGQVVVCPGVNDGEVLDDTLCGVADTFPELADVAVVPLGVSRHSREPRMRPHTRAEAARVVDVVEAWQERFLVAVGHRMVHAADEYYLLCDRPFPPGAHYGSFSMHEDGIGMARAFEAEFTGATGGSAIGVQPGFFSWVDGAPATGYRAPRWEADPHLPPPSPTGSPGSVPVELRRRDAPTGAPVTVLTGVLGARVIEPLVRSTGRDDVEVVAVENRFFGGNIGVTGLLTGEDLSRVLAERPAGRRYLLPDVCLSAGRFLDGMVPDDLPKPVEVLATDGVALARALAR